MHHHRLELGLFAVCLFSAAGPAHAVPTGTIEIRVQGRGAYCGGAAPTPEIVEQTSRVLPRGGVELFVRRGDRNRAGRPLMRGRTDATGQLTLAIPPGTYCLIGNDRLAAPTQAPGFDWVCQQREFERCEAVATVRAGQSTQLTIERNERCSWQGSPCDTRPRSAPPSAPRPPRE